MLGAIRPASRCTRTALRAPQIQALTLAPSFQLSLFDEQGLCEVSSPEFPDERLIICRNPAVAAERARKREELLKLTEADLEKVKQMVEGERGKLKNAPAGKIGERAGRVVNKRKMAKHFTLNIADKSFSYQRNTAQIADEALLDGIYVLRTAEPASRIGSHAVVRAYKQLKVNERAFREMKTPLEIRPVHHRLKDRVRAHVFLCMLACYVQFELTRRLAPMLFTDDTPLSPADPVAPAQRSAAANTKASSAHTADGHVAHSFEDLLKDLGTLCRNTIRIGNSTYTFTRLTTPTELQASAFELTGVKPGKETETTPPGTAKPSRSGRFRGLTTTQKLRANRRCRSRRRSGCLTATAAQTIASRPIASTWSSAVFACARAGQAGTGPWGGDHWRDQFQLTAFFMSALIFASSVAVRSLSANSTGHMAPSSRLALSLNPNVAYLVLNFSAGLKKHRTLPSLA